MRTVTSKMVAVEFCRVWFCILCLYGKFENACSDGLCRICFVSYVRMETLKMVVIKVQFDLFCILHAYRNSENGGHRGLRRVCFVSYVRMEILKTVGIEVGVRFGFASYLCIKTLELVVIKVFLQGLFLYPMSALKISKCL